METQPILEDNFKTLLWDRNEIVERLSKDKDLAKCLLSNDKYFKKYTPTEDEIEDLPFNNIFPCLYTFKTLQEVKSFITMGFEYSNTKTANIWKTGLVTFYCFCHKDIVRTAYGLRYDYMLQRVNHLMFNTKNSTWIGKMEFVCVKDIIMDGNSDYVGIMIKYKNTELM